MKNTNRTVMEEWCALLSNHSIEYYQNLSDQELEKEYKTLMTEATKQMETA